MPKAPASAGSKELLPEPIASSTLESRLCSVELRMHRSGWTPSIVPNEADQNVYLVEDCFDRLGCCWGEVDSESTELSTVIAELMPGSITTPAASSPLTPERWSQDVSEDGAREIQRRSDLAYDVNQLCAHGDAAGNLQRRRAALWTGQACGERTALESQEPCDRSMSNAETLARVVLEIAADRAAHEMI